MCPPCVRLTALRHVPTIVRHVSAIVRLDSVWPRPPCVRLVSAVCLLVCALFPKQLTVGLSLRKKKVGRDMLWPRFRSLSAICPLWPRLHTWSAMCPPCVRLAPAMCLLCLLSPLAPPCLPFVPVSALCVSKVHQCPCLWTLSVRGLLWGRAVAS